MNLRQLLQIAAMGVGSVVMVACGPSNDPHRLPAVHFKIQRVAAVPTTMKQMSDEVCVERTTCRRGSSHVGELGT